MTFRWPGKILWGPTYEIKDVFSLSKCITEFGKRDLFNISIGMCNRFRIKDNIFYNLNSYKKYNT